MGFSRLGNSLGLDDTLEPALETCGSALYIALIALTVVSMAGSGLHPRMTTKNLLPSK